MTVTLPRAVELECIAGMSTLNTRRTSRQGYRTIAYIFMSKHGRRNNIAGLQRFKPENVMAEHELKVII